MDTYLQLYTFYKQINELQSVIGLQLMRGEARGGGVEAQAPYVLSQ